MSMLCLEHLGHAKGSGKKGSLSLLVTAAVHWGGDNFKPRLTDGDARRKLPVPSAHDPRKWAKFEIRFGPFSMWSMTLTMPTSSIAVDRSFCDLWTDPVSMR